MANKLPEYPDPCSRCSSWQECKDKKIACQTFFDFVNSGIPRGIPERPCRYYYARIFNGKESNQVKGVYSNRKLNHRQVRLIRKMRDDRYSFAEVAEIFGISKGLVAQIHSRDVYRDVA